VLSTNQKGAIAETAIAHAAVKLGIEVYRPVAEGGRFDLIFAFADASLARVLCKWAPLVKGTIAIRAYSARRAAEGFRYRMYTAAEIDAIAAYSPETDACYYVPVERVIGRRVLHLRLNPARNNQVDRVNFASDYELGAIAQLGERSAGSRKVGGSSPPSSIDERAA
jgi:PD-(D/E)XK nuclease superfamily protein